MKKQPKLILRESCIDDVTRAWPAGSFVEMGAGTGQMSRLFLERGFTGAAHDLGVDSRKMIRERLAYAGERMRVVDDVAELPVDAFDYLFAFEVLEHIENDLEVLRGWMTHLKPGGRVLVSVPAHARKYGRSDLLVGHVRRYERSGLLSMLADVGVGDVHVVNYGYPLTEVTRRISNRLVKHDHTYDNLTPEERSIRSAQAKPKVINRVLALVSDRVVSPFRVVQRWFYGRDLGDGYVAWGTKRSA
jgi:SAM-dependent methyltransferase